MQAEPYTRELETLLRELNRRTVVGYLPEMRLGKVAYDFLLTALKDRSLTRHQRANALCAVHRLRAHGTQEEVFDLFIEHTAHDEIGVRTQAVNLLVGMIRSGKDSTSSATERGIGAIRTAVALGVYKPTAELATDFLEKTTVQQ